MPSAAGGCASLLFIILVMTSTRIVTTYGKSLISSICANEMPFMYDDAMYKPAKMIEPGMDNAGFQSVKITSAIERHPTPSRTYSQFPPL